MTAERVLDVLRAFQWGTVPDWVEALGTSLAFLIAAVAFLHEVANRRVAQARLVRGTLHGAPMFHGAGEPIDPGLNPLVVPVTWERGDPPIPSEVLSGSGRVEVPFGTVHVLVSVKNDSTEAVGPIFARALEPRRDKDAQWARLAEYLEPGEDTSATVIASTEKWENKQSASFEICFRDAAGRWWTRRWMEPVRRLKREPQELNPTQG